MPMDELLDLPSGDVTVSLSKRALRLATYMSFAALQEELRIQHDVRLSHSTLDRLMQMVGGVSERDRQTVTDHLQAAPVGLAREKKVAVEEVGPLPKRLYISCDGAMYPTRYRQADPEGTGEARIVYQEMKTGTVFWETPDGQWHKRVLAGRDDPQRFGLSLWALAVRCGMLQADEVIFISDGGSWCETISEGVTRARQNLQGIYALFRGIAESFGGDRPKLHLLKSSACLLESHRVSLLLNHFSPKCAAIPKRDGYFGVSGKERPFRKGRGCFSDAG